MTCQNRTATCDGCGRTICPRCGRCYERVMQYAPGNWIRQCPAKWCRYAKLIKSVMFR